MIFNTNGVTAGFQSGRARAAAGDARDRGAGVEEALRESEERLRAAKDAAGLGVWD